MLVGEAPGSEEVRKGKPFVGRAGQFLEKQLLPLAGLERSGIRISNTLLHRPPNNRDPFPEEIEACRPWLQLQLEMVDPKLVVLLGRFAIKAVLGIEAPMKELNGCFVRQHGRLYMLSMHPAAVLHQPSNRGLLLESFSGLGKVLAAKGSGAVVSSPGS